MKLWLSAIAVGVLLAMPSTVAATSYELPTINEFEARSEVTRFLHEKYPGWRHKRAGYVDCRHGRINSFTWSCAIGWVSGYANCQHGRARAINEYVENGILYYTVTATVKRWC